MFFPGKEEFIWLEEQMKLQEHIYNDAADSGVAITAKNREQFRDAIKALKSTFKSKIEELGERTDPVYNWTVSLFIPIEMDEGHVIGYQVDLTYIKDTKTRSRIDRMATEWMSITIRHVAREGARMEEFILGE